MHTSSSQSLRPLAQHSMRTSRWYAGRWMKEICLQLHPHSAASSPFALTNVLVPFSQAAVRKAKSDGRKTRAPRAACAGTMLPGPHVSPCAR